MFGGGEMKEGGGGEVGVEGGLERQRRAGVEVTLGEGRKEWEQGGGETSMMNE